MSEPIRRSVDNEDWIFDPGLELTAQQLDEIAELLKRTLSVAGTRRDLLELQRLLDKIAAKPVFIQTPGQSHPADSTETREESQS